MYINVIYRVNNLINQLVSTILVTQLPGDTHYNGHGHVMVHMISVYRGHCLENHPNTDILFSKMLLSVNV